MSDDQIDIHAELAELRKELDQLASDKPEVREHFESVAAQIERLLDEQAGEEPGATSDEQATLIERLSETARQFEEEHPTLSAVLGRMIDGLGQMGI